MIALWMIYSIIVAAALGIAAALLERTAPATLAGRRWWWAAAIALASALPVWAAQRPASAAAAAAPAESAANPRALELPGRSIDSAMSELIARADARWLERLDTVLLVAWGVCAAVAFGGYGLATWSLASRRRRWRREVIDGHEVLLTASVGPAVVGTIQPAIVVPTWSLTLSPSERALMLEHEREHIKAHDPLLLHAASLAAILMPWNVAVWWLNRRLRTAVELDCDARVLAAGRDAHEYGTLLLNVCSHRTRGGPLLAPALLERTSSLSRRILAMNPTRTRFPRARVALGAAGATAMLVLACDMPSPEMLAPDGSNVARTRVYGSVAQADPTDLRSTVARYFPSVARGEGGPAILYIVKSPTKGVVMTDMQPATEFVKMPARAPVAAGGQLSDGQLRERVVQGQRLAPTPVRPVEFKRTVRPATEAIRTGQVELTRKAEPSREVVGRLGIKLRTARERVALPIGIGALQPTDIESIEVSKHAAGKLAPNAVSIIFITLKPRAAVSTEGRLNR